MKNTLSSAVLAISMITNTLSKAQSYNFSQLQQCGFLLNPASCGATDSDHVFRLQINARQSPFDLKSYPYQSGVLALEYKQALKEERTNLGFGLVSYYKKTGEPASLNVAYTGITAALHHNFTNKKDQVRQLSFGMQWVIVHYSLEYDLSTRKLRTEANTMQMGLNYKHTNLNWGFESGYSIANLNKPTIHYWPSEYAHASMKHNLYSKLYNHINRTLLNTASIFYAQEGAENMLQIGDQIGYVMRKGRVGFGIAYRFAYAIIPSINYQNKNWSCTISHDVSTRNHTSTMKQKGAWELSLIYQGH